MRPQPRTENSSSPSTRTALPTQFINFSFFQMEPEWRQLSAQEQKKGKQEFIDIIESYQNKKGVFVLPYSLIGIRSDADFMLWRIANQIEVFEEMTSKLRKTGLGKYLRITYSFLSITKRSMYVDNMDPQHQNPRTHIIPGRGKYLFVYPFVKTRDWYQLSFPARQGMMDEHIQIGSKYPSVKLNTTYSFGIDDQEFVVAFETDEVKEFLNLVQELRETEASRYTLRDVPMFTSLSRSIQEIVDLF